MQDFEIKSKTNNAIREFFFQRYPTLFEGIDPFNFDLPVGWMYLVYNLCEHIKDFPLKIKQVKQKMGSLRVYVDTEKLTPELQAEVWAFCTDAEKESHHICEMCGTQGNVVKTDSHFIQSLCENCRKLK